MFPMSRSVDTKNGEVAKGLRALSLSLLEN